MISVYFVLQFANSFRHHGLIAKHLACRFGQFQGGGEGSFKSLALPKCSVMSNLFALHAS